MSMIQTQRKPRRRKLRADERITHEYLPNLAPEQEASRFRVYGDTTSAISKLELQLWHARAHTMWGVEGYISEAIETMTHASVDWKSVKGRPFDELMHNFYAKTFTESL